MIVIPDNHGTESIASIRQAIRDIPDFPKPGIVFKDIMPLLGDGRIFRRTIDILAERYRSQKIDTVLGIESRGFIIGAALAYELAPVFVSCASRGNYPTKPTRRATNVEYGTDSLEIDIDAIPHNARVVIVDDLIATGGTAAATAELVDKLAEQWWSAPS